MKFLFLRILLSIALLNGFVVVTHAANDVDWDEYSIYTDYDAGDEELEVRFSTFSDGDPKEDFELEMKVGDEKCTVELEYKSFNLSGVCKLDIKKEDVRGIYNTSLEITSLDSNDEAYTDNTVEFEIDGFEEDFDWEKINIDAVYDEDDEELEMKIYLENVSREPDFDYEIEFKIDNKTFKRDLRYNEDDKELSVSFDTPIDKDDIEKDYEVSIEVFNTDDDDDRVGNEKVEFDVEMIGADDEFDWDELDATAVYDEDRGRLSIELFLEDIKSEPKGNYRSFIEFENEDYDEKFKYDDDRNALLAEYSIKIDEDDLGYFYDLEVKVEDNYEDEVYDDEIDIDVELLSEADDFDWDELDVSASYNENKEMLYIELVLENIKSKPVFIYTTDVEFEDEEEFKKFTYNSDKNELRASIDVRIDEDDVLDEYELDIKIENDDQNRVYNEDIDVEVLDYQDVASEEAADYDWKNMSVSFDYLTSSQYLIINIELEGISNYPSLDYFADLNVSGLDEEIGSKLRYDSQNKKLYGTYNIHIKENVIEDEYNLTMFINDEFKQLQYLLTEKFDVIFDAGGSEDDEGTRYVSSATKKAVENFTDKIYDRYDNKFDAIEYFKIVITTLDTYAQQKTRYKSVIDDINYLLQEEIDNN